jgi:hypothetical protein
MFKRLELQKVEDAFRRESSLHERALLEEARNPRKKYSKSSICVLRKARLERLREQAFGLAMEIHEVD